MSQPEEPSGGADSPEEPAETGDERGGSETLSLLDADVEGPINAAVQNSELDERGAEGG